MTFRSLLLASFVVLCARALTFAQGPIRLREVVTSGTAYHVSTHVDLSGELTVPPDEGQKSPSKVQLTGRSFIEYAVSRGLQIFLLSWRNPGKEQADWDLDTYAARVLQAIDAVREITGSDDVNTIGFCAGGIINTGVLNHLAATGDTRIHSASFAVTMLDFGQRAPIQAFSNAKLLSFARAHARLLLAGVRLGDRDRVVDLGEVVRERRLDHDALDLLDAALVRPAALSVA